MDTNKRTLNSESKQKLYCNNCNKEVHVIKIQDGYKCPCGNFIGVHNIFSGLKDLLNKTNRNESL